jgi:hypothetical protein
MDGGTAVRFEVQHLENQCPQFFGVVAVDKWWLTIHELAE